MIGRTPPPKKQRIDSRPADSSLAASDRQVVIYEDPPAVADPPADHLLCTYQCRQMVKADFFDALSNAENQAHDYKSKWETLAENFSKVEGEKKKFREQLLYAEQELAAARGREEALQKQLLKEVDDSKEQFIKQLQSYSELEAKLQNEVNLRKKSESSVALAEEKVENLQRHLSHLSESTEQEKKSLQNELVQVKKESKSSISRIRAQVEKMECRAINAEKESELLKKQLDDLQKQLNECLQQMSESEKKLATLIFHEPSSTDTSSIIEKHLREELRSYESEVQEARKLRSTHEQAAILREKLLEERSRREVAESEISKLQELHSNIKNLDDELLSWKLKLKEIPGVSCPDDLPIKFASLQKEVLESTMKLSELPARLKHMEVALDAAQLGKGSAERDAALAREKAQELGAEIKQIRSMLSMVSEERDKLRSLVNEHKSPTKDDAGGHERINQSLVQELQSSFAKKECFIKELESSLHGQKEFNNHQRDEIKLLSERLNDETRRIKLLERDNDRLRSEISLLESKLGHGDFSSANTKVLRMVNTLGVDSEAKQTIEALRSELQKTKDKLKAVEELNDQSGDNAGKLVDSSISERIMQLKEQIATLEKREERYKTVFADRISVFRRACCELFGYKILMDEHQRSNGIPVTRFTLQSIYGQNDDEKLEFEYESGNVVILANAFTSQPEITRQVGIFINKLNSIPAFTANLTVESFNRRTLS